MIKHLHWGIISVFVLMGSASLGQVKSRKLTPPLNHPSINYWAPFVSLDGNSLAYLSDDAEDNALTVFYSTRDNVTWRDPVMLPRSINNRMTFVRGFALSPDGKTLFLTSMRSGGIGGYDILISELRGTVWSEPVNPGTPLNSALNDGSPSLSPDGSLLYFMRCEKMDQNKASGCRLFTSKRINGGRWSEAEELPSVINTGNSQSPRISGDGETLIFSSDKLVPNQGGMDLYITQRMPKGWSAPVALAFTNTAQDDQFVSLSSAGRYLLRDLPGQRKSELVEVLFPAETRPKGVTKVMGTIDGFAGATGYVSVYSVSTRARIAATTTDAQGKFSIYLKEGDSYDIVAEHASDHFTFFLKRYDFTGDRNQVLEKFSGSVTAVKPGMEIPLETVAFDATGALQPTSAIELEKAARIMQGNAGRRFIIDVTLQGYREDSVKSDPDLTEVKADTLHYPVTVQLDSVTTETRDSVVVEYTYHNDRTARQADAVSGFLAAKGVSKGAMEQSVHRNEEAVPEKRRVLVKLIVR